MDQQSSSISKYKNFKSPKTTPNLAAETWDNILSYLHSRNFLRVINTCPEWNQLLSARKTKELFTLVFPHLLPYFKVNELCPFLPIFDLILGNPFLTRSIRLDLLPNKVWWDTPHFRALKNLFSRYGSNIWRLDVTFYQLPTDNFQLTNYLSNLPHLKTLTLYGAQTLDETEDFSDTEPEVFTRRGKSSLPTLRELRHLEVTGFKANHELLVSECTFKYGPQLTTLRIEGVWLGQRSCINSINTALQNLRKLSVARVNSCTLERLSVMELPLLEILELDLPPMLSTTDPSVGGNDLLLSILNFENLLQLVIQYEPELVVLEDFDSEKEEDEEEMPPQKTIKLDSNLTGFGEEDRIHLCKYAFGGLPELEEVVFRRKLGDGRYEKSVVERANVLL